MTSRPTVGGFPYFAETLRCAGVIRNLWTLPAAQSIYLTTAGPVVVQGTPLVTSFADVPAFDREALITTLRTEQAGVVRYDVDFIKRTVTYYGAHEEEYVEAYPAVEIGVA